MVNFTKNIYIPFHEAYDSAKEIGNTAQNKVGEQVQRVQQSFTNAYQAIGQSYRTTVNAIPHTAARINQKFYETINKIKDFLYNNKETLFFIGCCVATAYFAPHLFFPVAIATIIIRVEFNRYLKQVADHYLKDERNPYKLNPQYKNCVSYIDLAMGAVGAADAIALGTLFVASSWSVVLLPVFAGIAAGNAIAKAGMNATNFLQ